MKDGYGQCNTKGTLFMALFRSVDIPCRFHGFTIDKKLQKEQPHMDGGERCLFLTMLFTAPGFATVQPCKPETRQCL